MGIQRKDKIKGLQLHCYTITYILAKQYCETSVTFMVTSLLGHDDNNNQIVSFPGGWNKFLSLNKDFHKAVMNIWLISYQD